MVARERRLLGLSFAIVGFVGTIVICALPAWRVHRFDHQSNIVAAVFSQGLWKVCNYSSAEHVECKQYENKGFSSTVDLEVARVLIVIAIIIGVFGILLGDIGSKFLNFVPDEMEKSRIAMASGVAFLIAGLFVLIPVCWTTVTIIYVLPHDYGKREPGVSLHIGWITTALLCLGGSLLCSSFICRDGTDQDVEYTNP